MESVSPCIETRPCPQWQIQKRRKELETKPETTNKMRKLADYVRWFVLGVVGLAIIFTIVMAVYRKFGG
jgi:hypothetical protein